MVICIFFINGGCSIVLVYEMGKDEGKASRTFKWLCKYIKDVNLEVLKQVSVYIARTNEEFNVYRECKINFDNDKFYELLLSNGSVIKIFKEHLNFGFYVFRSNEDVSMQLIVSEKIKGKMHTANVYCEIRIKDNGMYVLSFRPNDMSDDSLKYGAIHYFTEEEIDWALDVIDEEFCYNFDLLTKKHMIYPFAEKSFFDVIPQFDLEMDIFNGYLTTPMIISNLLYDNVSKICDSNKLVKIKSK